MTTPIPAFFRLDDSIATGAQPPADALPWLTQQGFASVLNVNTSTARSFLPDEGPRLEQTGVRYVHHPIDCSVLTKEKYEGFRDALEELLPHGPVFVHCAGNVKVTGMMHLFRVLERGESVERASEDLAKLPALEPKWYEFFERMGVPTKR